MKKMMSDEELQKKTDEELEGLWSTLVRAFNDKGCKDQPFTGLLQITKETDRRGLELKQDRFNKVYLIPKPQTKQAI